MEKTSFLEHVIKELSEDLEVSSKQTSITEEELLSAIASRVGELMDRNPGLLFSYLYRLDVKEEKLNAVLNTHSEKPIALRIAILILERQKVRWKTKQDYDTDIQMDGWEW